jgi:hypothetical protein
VLFDFGLGALSLSCFRGELLLSVPDETGSVPKLVTKSEACQARSLHWRLLQSFNGRNMLRRTSSERLTLHLVKLAISSRIALTVLGAWSDSRPPSSQFVTCSSHT